MAKDKCIMCGEDSAYEFETHVDMRVGYIEGAGQLCINCYSKGTNHGAVAVDYNTVLSTPNDQELGAKVRKLYYENNS